MTFFFPVILLVGLGLTYALFRKSRRERKKFPVVGRALGGLCLAYVGQALLVAKHPAGHYMIPVLTTGGLGLALVVAALGKCPESNAADESTDAGSGLVRSSGLLVLWVGV